MRRKALIGKTLGIFVVMLVLLMTVGSAADEVRKDTSGEWKYVLEEDGITLMGYVIPSVNLGPGYRSSDLIIPSELDGYTVTGIGEYAFFGCSEVTDVTIPGSVTSIGNNAFGSCGLASVTIPNHVTSIGSNPFRGCPLLAITVPDDHPTYAQTDGVLMDKQLKTLVSYPSARKGAYTVPDEILRIGDWAFYGCENLPVVAIPDSVTDIGVGAFYGSSLTDVTLPGSVTSIEPLAFSWCKSLTGITIPDSVTSIGERAFDACDNLIDVIIPDSVISIGSEAFGRCTSLSNLTLPASVTDIGEYAFSGSKNLTLTVQAGSYAEQYAKENRIPYNVAQSQRSMVAPQYPEKVTLIDGRTVNIRSGPGTDHPQIGEAYPGVSFYFTGIEENGFYQILYPSIQNDQGYVTAYVMESLATVSPAGSQDMILSTSIGDIAVVQNANVYLDAALSKGSKGKISDYHNVPYAGVSPSGSYAVLLNRTNDKGETVLWIGFISPDDVDMNGVAGGEAVAGEVRMDATGQWVYVLSASGAAIEYMKDPRGNVVIPDELGGYPVTELSDWAFECSFMLTGITIPDSVTHIGDSAFTECYELKSVTIPKNVTSIGERAFSQCYGLQSLNIPAGVTDIGEDAFADCGALTLTVAEGSYAARYAEENNVPYRYGVE